MVVDPTNSMMNQYVPIEGTTFNTLQQHVPPEEPALNNQCNSDNNMFKVQLPYDINQALNPES